MFVWFITTTPYHQASEEAIKTLCLLQNKQTISVSYWIFNNYVIASASIQAHHIDLEISEYSSCLLQYEHTTSVSIS